MGFPRLPRVLWKLIPGDAWAFRFLQDWRGRGRISPDMTTAFITTVAGFLVVLAPVSASIVEEGDGIVYGEDDALNLKEPKEWMLDNESDQVAEADVFLGDAPLMKKGAK